uniref:Potassium channel domain-containing protein n=1 Tax=Photinus pyralis TaxID=7054 RepID=A0A1Y1L471_PHOPY
MEPLDIPPPLPPRIPISRPSSLILADQKVEQDCEVTSKKSRNIPKLSKKRAYRYTRKQFAVVKGGIKGIAQTGLSFGEKFTYGLYEKFGSWSHMWFTHCFLTFILIIYTAGGALVFVSIEGSKEKVKQEYYTKGMILRNLRDTRGDFVQELKNYSKNLNNETDEEWNLRLRKKLEDYEEFMVEVYQNFTVFRTRNNPKSWTFFNAIVYCGTLYTTIGYGHMFPTTELGMIFTIIYALIGIPLFLITLTDFGKLFTRAIKALWTYVRRLYYTGSCRKVRKKARVSEIIQGAQLVYGIALASKRAVFSDGGDAENENPQSKEEKESKMSPADFEVDDEFNLPISVAIAVLLVYIFLGAIMYWIWESWDFFTAFYFVFISLSTIGFGDYVPIHNLCMITSVAYLVFGLALMSMCINVVQLKLAETFSIASTKLRATIGKGGNQTELETEAEIPCAEDIRRSLIITEDNEDNNEENDLTETNVMIERS